MSKVDLANEALQILGTRSSVADLDEDSNEARQIKIVMDTLRKRLIRAAPWGFCKAVASLAVLKAMPGTPENPSAPITSNWLPTYPPPGWLYAYGYPSDAERIRYVASDGGYSGGSVPLWQGAEMYTGPMGLFPQRFAVSVDRINGNDVKIIATNAARALCVYNRDIEDDALWESDFREAYVHLLASRVARQLTGEQEVRVWVQLVNQKIMDAAVADANEAPTTYNTIAQGLKSREAFFDPSFADQFPVP